MAGCNCGSCAGCRRRKVLGIPGVDQVGQVLQNTGAAFTSTNEVVVETGDWYTAFPGNPGTTWAGEEPCDVFVERLVLDVSASTAGADFGSGTAITAISDGTFDPGEAAHQAYIDANIDYTAPDGDSTSLNPPDTGAIGQTDSGWVAFHVVVPAGGTRTLTWEWAGEGYGRLEVAECGVGDYEIVDATWTGAGAGTAQVTVTLDAGVHLIRMTQVDSGGNANAWAYVGDPIEFYAASGATPVVSMQLVAVDCDGNVTDPAGNPVTGTLMAVAEWSCSTGVVVNTEDLIGDLFVVTAGTTADPTDDSLGTATMSVGDRLHFYIGAPGEGLSVDQGSGIVRLPSEPAGDVAQCGTAAGPITNPTSEELFQFTPHITGTYKLIYSADSITGPTPTAGVFVGTTAGAGDVHGMPAASAGLPGGRLTDVILSGEADLALTEGVTYFFTGFAGGGSTANGLSACAATSGLSSYVAELAGAADDPASTELGNLIIEGDDGEEYALPLKSEECFIETLAPAPLAGVNALNLTGNLTNDDFFAAAIENTTADAVTVAAIELTTGVWANPTPATISAVFGTSTGSVGISASGTYQIALSPPLVIEAGGTVAGFVSSNLTAGGAQPIDATEALVSEEVRHIVRTYSDGETDRVIEFDAAGDPQEITIDPLWTPCGPFTNDETAEIIRLIEETDLVTTEIVCKTENLGFDGASPLNTTGSVDAALPQTIDFTPAVNMDRGLITIAVDDVAPLETDPFEVTLEIVADGVLVETRVREAADGTQTFVNFGHFDFVAGVAYEMTVSTAATTLVNMTGYVDPIPATFQTPTVPVTYPSISITAASDQNFRIVTLSDGTQVAYNEVDTIVPIDPDWIDCPDLTDGQVTDVTELIEEALDDLICPPIGVTEVAPTLETTSRTIGLPGTIVAPGVAVTASQGATGQTQETPIQFHGRLPGEVVDAVMRVTRLGAGGGAIVIQAAGAITNTSGGTDHLIEVELAGGLAFRWTLHLASAGGSESFQFLDNPVVEYAPGAGGIALTLPSNEVWNNGNNSAQSGMAFAAANTLTFRSNGVAGATSSMVIALRDVPTLPAQTACERSASLLTLIEGNVPECDVVGAAEELDGQSGTLADGTTWFRTLTDTISASTLTDGIGGDVRWDNSGLITYTFSKPVNFLAGPTSDPALADPIVWTYVNAPPPNTNNGPWTRLISDGDPVEYVPGAVDVTPFLNTLGPSQADAGQANTGAASTAQDDWGLFTAPAAMVVTIEGRDAEAMNFSAQPVSQVGLCDLVQSGGTQQAGAITVISS